MGGRASTTSRKGMTGVVAAAAVLAATALLFGPGARAAHGSPCAFPYTAPGCHAPGTTSPPPPTLPTLPPPTTTTQPPPAPRPDTAAAARRLLDLLNQERTSRGLPALVARVDIAAIAVGHSRDMAAKYDIWHNDAYFTAATHDALGAVFLGENVAMNPKVDTMHARLMESPHHRDNILDARFQQVGIGVAAAPDGELFATEDFAQPRPTARAGAPRPAVRPAAAQPAAPAMTLVAADPEPTGPGLDAAAVVTLPGSLVRPSPARPARPPAGDDHSSLPAAAVALVALAAPAAALPRRLRRR
jgi:uncharacterized protein YkwD